MEDLRCEEGSKKKGVRTEPTYLHELKVTVEHAYLYFLNIVLSSNDFGGTVGFPISRIAAVTSDKPSIGWGR